MHKESGTVSSVLCAAVLSCCVEMATGSPIRKSGGGNN